MIKRTDYLEISVDKSTVSFYNTSLIQGGPVAQGLEQPAHNRPVLGSNPSGPTTFFHLVFSFPRNPAYGALAQGYERYLHTVEVTGSNPVRPIIFFLSYFLTFVLKLIQPVVDAPLLKQLVVRPHLLNFTTVHDNDLIRVLNCG